MFVYMCVYLNESLFVCGCACFCVCMCLCECECVYVKFNIITERVLGELKYLKTSLALKNATKGFF